MMSSRWLRQTKLNVISTELLSHIALFRHVFVLLVIIYISYSFWFYVFMNRVCCVFLFWFICLPVWFFQGLVYLFWGVYGIGCQSCYSVSKTIKCELRLPFFQRCRKHVSKGWLRITRQYFKFPKRKEKG